MLVAVMRQMGRFKKYVCTGNSRDIPNSGKSMIDMFRSSLYISIASTKGCNRI